MITNDLSNLTIVSAFDSSAAGGYRACTVAGTGTCTCGGYLSTDIGLFGFGGFMIDRFGLKDNYAAAAIAIDAQAEVGSSAASTVMLTYYAITAGLQHSSTTCSGGFSNLTTADWITNRPLLIQTTATSSGTAFGWTSEGTLVAAPIALFASVEAGNTTSTGYARYVGDAPVFNLAEAKRFIRVVIAPNILTTGCATPAMSVRASLLFGDPSNGPFIVTNVDGTASTQRNVRGRVIVTTGCST